MERWSIFLDLQFRSVNYPERTADIDYENDNINTSHFPVY